MAETNWKIEVDTRDLVQMSFALNRMGKRIKSKSIIRVTRAAARQGVDVVMQETAAHMAGTGISMTRVRRNVQVAYFNGGSATTEAIMSSGWFRLAEHGLGRKGGGGLTNKLGFHRGAFKATMGSGHRGIFTRTTAARFPIRELWGLNPMREIERGQTDALQQGGDRAADALEQFAIDLLQQAA